MPARRTTTERGLGWQHQQIRRRLIANHRDGSPCPCLTLDDCGTGCPCRAAGHGLPMFKDAASNPDKRPLEADHTTARSRGGTRADRLILATCNGSRGDGSRGGATSERHTWWSRRWYDDEGGADATDLHDHAPAPA
jgi:hypothetical protein